MTWKRELLDKCYDAMRTQGEVRIQFMHRSRGSKTVAVPIIKNYPQNQRICEEVELDNS